MTNYVHFDADGRIGGSTTGGAPEGTIVHGFPFFLQGSWSGETHYIAGGSAVPRPQITPPVPTIFPATQDYTITGVPDGAVIALDGAAVATADGTDITVSFPEPGQYQIAIDPPFPWRAAQWWVEAT
ncbi:hypothetical protein [Roseicitreum antarcticum]|uniref:Uncharacterized protein n=1 Tax=Roseicitreum antarcticum TaxID=564137 RepID=A0A1H2WDD3_9RHOB|nr:hypothetical protein [Roseicitreum antarcticum]SDW78538.1 hypothetical protein SAMN04488238_103345 [Roseicitreum antarcticum]